MLINSKYLKLLIITLALCNSITAIADETKLKIAAIKKELGITNSNVLAFHKNMNLCAELTQAKKTNETEIACTAAITSIKSIKNNTPKAKYLESLSYNNRAISRYINNDLPGAKNDLITASLIDSNSITEGNLKLVNRVLSDDNSTDKPTNMTE